MTRNIIIAHYNENLDWLESLNTIGNILIYSKTFPSQNFISINKGQEVPMYLKYILDNYNSLADKNLFLHGHRTSPHQDYDSDFICKNVDWNCANFFSVNKRDWYQEVSKRHEVSKGSFHNWLKANWSIYEKYLPFPEDGLFFYSGAQFIVDKELILQYPIDFYMSLYNWILQTNLDTVITSRIFEYTWHYIFTKNPIERKINTIII